MDAIFHKCHGLRGYVDVVRAAEELPRRYGKNGELLIAYDETEEHKAHVQHHNHHPGAGDEQTASSNNSDAEKGVGVVVGSS